MLKKGDFILAVIIVLFVAGSYFGMTYNKNEGNNTKRTAVIRQGDKEVGRINLDEVGEPYKIDIKGDYHLVVLAENGRIRVLDANCPDRVCVKTGWLRGKGDAAVCIPNRTIIKVEGESGKVDGVAY